MSEELGGEDYKNTRVTKARAEEGRAAEGRTVTRNVCGFDMAPR